MNLEDITIIGVNGQGQLIGVESWKADFADKSDWIVIDGDDNISTYLKKRINHIDSQETYASHKGHIRYGESSSSFGFKSAQLDTNLPQSVNLTNIVAPVSAAMLNFNTKAQTEDINLFKVNQQSLIDESANSDSIDTLNLSNNLGNAVKTKIVAKTLVTESELPQQDVGADTTDNQVVTAEGGKAQETQTTAEGDSSNPLEQAAEALSKEEGKSSKSSSKGDKESSSQSNEQSSSEPPPPPETIPEGLLAVIDQLEETNDAPILNNGTPLDLDNIHEDIGKHLNDGTSVEDILNSLGSSVVSDLDGTTDFGIAVTGFNDNHGNWSYSTNGGSSWQAFGPVSDTNATLLSHDALVRFVPDANYHGPSGNITFRAWDQSEGTNGSKNVNVSNNGGETAFSSSAVHANLFIQSVNDAPIVHTNVTIITQEFNEDQGVATSGDTLANILDSLGVGGANLMSDIDGDSLGIAVVNIDNTNGDWQYSLNGGGTWINFGAVSNTNATLLNQSAMVRFVPDPDFNGNLAPFNFRAWDQSTGSHGQTGVNVSNNGGTTAFSQNVISVPMKVLNINDAPVLDNASPLTMTNINEDTASGGGDMVDSIFNSLGPSVVTDIDGTTQFGMAVTNVDNTNGTWEYSIDGGSNWIAFGAVSPTNATLLEFDDLVRFTPSGDYNGNSGDITFKAWDQYAGTGSGGDTGVDLAAVNVGSDTFSANAITASLNINAVNDAPILDDATPLTLTNINEDITTAVNGGNTVGDILTSQGPNVVTDTADGNASVGIAVTNVDNTYGTWEYSTDGGSNWFAFGAVSEVNATLLDSFALIRFDPFTHFNGNSGNITFRGWDKSLGNDGDTGVDVSTNGGTTAFSSNTLTASVTVNAINDAPLLDNASPLTLTDVGENIATTSNNGDSVDSILKSLGPNAATDTADGTTNLGMAVIGVDDTNGTWQYSTDGGSNWTDFGATVNNFSAVLLSHTSLVRFQPDAHYDGPSGNITFRAWDQTTGLDGDTAVDVSTNGGTTAFSTNTVNASLNVTNTNFEPATNAVSNTVMNPLVITLTGSDIDGTVTKFKLDSLPSDGTLYTDDDYSVTASTGVEYTATDESLTLYFLPTPIWSGVTTFNFIAIDDDGAEDLTSALATFTIPANLTYGTNSDNIMIGGITDDYIYGLGGQDTLDGLIGHDHIFGGKGDDTIDGGAGTDTLRGGANNDILDGGTGDDILFGDGGNDQLHGFDDNDTLYGGNGTDLLWGENGKDSLYGGDGNDILDGGSNIDYLDGGAGADTLYGGSEDDTLVFDAADLTQASAIDGGSGVDTLLMVGSNNVDLTSVSDSYITDIEKLDLNTTDANTLTLNQDDVGSFNASNRAEILGDSQDTVNVEDANAGDAIDWVDNGIVNVGGVDYTHLSYSTTHDLYIQDTINYNII